MIVVTWKLYERVAYGKSGRFFREHFLAGSDDDFNSLSECRSQFEYFKRTFSFPSNYVVRYSVGDDGMEKETYIWSSDEVSPYTGEPVADVEEEEEDLTDYQHEYRWYYYRVYKDGDTADEEEPVQRQMRRSKSTFNSYADAEAAFRKSDLRKYTKKGFQHDYNVELEPYYPPQSSESANQASPVSN